MADKIVKIYGDARFLPRHDTLENWQTKNPILLGAEPSYVIDGEDGKKIKFGDGVTPWNDLPYLSSNINNGGDITVDQTYSPTSKNAQSGKAVAEAISEALMDYDHNFSEIKGLNVIRVQRGENGTHTSILKYISALSADERILVFDNEIVIEVSDSIEYLNSIGFEVDSTYQIKISNGELEYIGKLKKGAPTIVDQSYNPDSENAQSGKAVAEAIAPKLDKPEIAPEVGKVLKVKSVNEDGTFICEWASGSNDWVLIAKGEITEEVLNFIIDKDMNGNDFELSEFHLRTKLLSSNGNNSSAVFSINKRPCTGVPTCLMSSSFYPNENTTYVISFDGKEMSISEPSVVAGGIGTKRCWTNPFIAKSFNDVTQPITVNSVQIARINSSSPHIAEGAYELWGRYAK